MSTEKRDTLIAIEKKYQQIWADTGVFHQDAPSTQDVPLHSVSADELREKYPKHFATMAYPYMNGTLHAGHAFTASKAEFATGWARMKGQRALFPLGFHCTGMPIKACSDKLEREIEMFGTSFERYEEESAEDAELPPPTAAETKEDITKFRAQKSKAAAKAGKAKYQFQIMKSLGIPVEEIHRFSDPNYWLTFFPPLCIRDMTSFGARVDWRRSMITTDENPYYDAFVRWQMNRLKEMGKIKFGKRYTVYSPKDGQPCMDHDRSTGEGVAPQEYTALKMKVKEWSEAAQKIMANKLPEAASTYFIPATLRPETMYGQTCCFVGPSVEYGIFKASESEYYFCSPRAARNMAYQGIFPKWGEFERIATLHGSDVVGTLVDAPLSVHKDGVRILPMETVKPTKGTGVVTSVPSDSPDDYATVLDLAKKADYYRIKKEWAELDIIPIIETPSYGNLTAPTLVKKLKIHSPKDAKPLAEAKELAYKEGFYQGTMVYGEFKGKPVQEAKNLVKQLLVDRGLAFNYAEPDGLVISRSADECVAAYLDQWFLNYGTTANGGDGEWCDTVLNWIDQGLNTYGEETKHQFEQTMSWLANWACARSYGLGSKLPWDTKFLVESLSDSTIYMSYYTIAHFLHRDWYGREIGPANITPEQMTDDVWDYIVCRREDIQTNIPRETLEKMRREFEYWYPLDVRVSGKDLIQNHLTFFLYIHIAMFPKEYWPRAIRANGHLMLNGEKMSKSTGNFLTLQGAVQKYGADATRIAMADSGDTLDDANFEETVANAVILKLFELKKWCEEVTLEARLIKTPADYKEIRDNEKGNIDVVQRDESSPKLLWDELFDNEMNGLVDETRTHYENTMYKLALKTGFYDFTAARDFYREATKAAGVGMHQGVLRRYVELQTLLITVIAPHWSDYVWQEVLKNPDSVQNALYPTVPLANPSLTATRDYIRTTSSNITSAEGAQLKRQAKGKAISYDPKKPKKLSIYVAKSFPAWQEKYIDLAREAFDGLTINMKKVQPKMNKAEMKKAMPFCMGLKKRVDAGEDAKAVFDRELPFSEIRVLLQMVPGLQQTIQKLEAIALIGVSEGGEGIVIGEDGKETDTKVAVPQHATNAVPGQPTFNFENIAVDGAA